MTILLVPDKFKGSLSAMDVCNALREGLLASYPGIAVVSIPLADGGEGTSNLLTASCGGRDIWVRVMDPLFREIQATYGTTPDGHMAFIEMAAASGLQLLKPEEQNPLYTSTYGTGQMIRHAMDNGAREIVIGIGGSATNDAGLGMAEALGFCFLSVAREKLKPTGENLIRLGAIRSDQVHPRLHSTKFTVLCDVENPLAGPRGAAYVFGPQKGAGPEAVEILDRGLVQFRTIAETISKVNLDFPGAGAAGGLGAGAKLFLNASLTPGFEFMASFTGLEQQITNADLIVSGEGKVDVQTLSGKVVMGVAGLARKHHKPFVVITGKNELSETDVLNLGIQKLISLVDAETTDQEAIQNAYGLLKEKARLILSIPPE